MIKLGLQQNLEQRLELGVGLIDPAGMYLDGSPEDLKTFLTDCPQEDEQGRINYVLSGGWAIEMLTGKKREHHDLDIINFSRVPLVWKIDEQKPRNYFGIISMKPQELLENHTQQINWDMSESYPEVSESEFEVCVPSNEYLFLSKIAGFLKEPRKKDYLDLESLSGIIKPNNESISKFESLLNHVPGMHRQFHKNKQLFTDISEYFKNIKGPSKKIAGAYLSEIIKNFQEGKIDFAKKQASKFHDTLKRIYESGLQECISLKEEGIDYDKFENAWAENKLSGFWVKNNGDVDLRIPKTQLNLKHLNFLNYWQNLEDSSKVKLSSLERVVAYSKIFKGKEKDSEKYLLVKDKKPITEFLYNSINFVPMHNLGKTKGAQKGLIEGLRTQEEKLVRDVYSGKGELIFSSNVFSESQSQNIGGLYKELMSSSDYENMKLLEDYAVKSKGMKRIDFEIEREKNFGNLLQNENYEKAIEFESIFKSSTMDYLKKNHIRGFIKRAYPKESWMLDTNYENLKKAMIAKKHLKVELPEDEVKDFHFDLIESEKYSWADKFAKSFKLNEKVEMENRNARLEDLMNNGFLLDLKKFSEHYKQPLQKDFVEECIRKWPESSNAYLLSSELSYERAVKAYALLLKERRIGHAERIKSRYDLDNSVDYELFCKDPFIFGHKDVLDSLEIPVDEKSQSSAMILAEEYMFGKGHKRKEKSRKVIEKFSIPYEKISKIAKRRFNKQIEKGYLKRLNKQYRDLVLKEKILDSDDIDKYLTKKARILKQSHDYKGARYITETILYNPELYDSL